MLSLPSQYDIFEWEGPAWRRGDVVVRAGYMRTPKYGGSMGVAVVDIRSGAVVRLLDLEFFCSPGLCVVLAWLDAETVLIHLEWDRVLAWNVTTGEVTLAGERYAGTLALRDHAGH